MFNKVSWFILRFLNCCSLASNMFCNCLWYSASLKNILVVEICYILLIAWLQCVNYLYAENFTSCSSSMAFKLHLIRFLCIISSSLRNNSSSCFLSLTCSSNACLSTYKQFCNDEIQKKSSCHFLISYASFYLENYKFLIKIIKSITYTNKSLFIIKNAFFSLPFQDAHSSQFFIVIKRYHISRFIYIFYKLWFKIFIIRLVNWVIGIFKDCENNCYGNFETNAVLFGS